MAYRTAAWAALHSDPAMRLWARCSFRLSSSWKGTAFLAAVAMLRPSAVKSVENVSGHRSHEILHSAIFGETISLPERSTLRRRERSTRPRAISSTHSTYGRTPSTGTNRSYISRRLRLVPQGVLVQTLSQNGRALCRGCTPDLRSMGDSPPGRNSRSDGARWPCTLRSDPPARHDQTARRKAMKESRGREELEAPRKFCYCCVTARPFKEKKKALLPLVLREGEPFYLAVTVGFEPTLAFTPNNISSVAPSAARTRHQPQ